MIDVTALGELLVDFISDGYSERSNPIFEANPGGAPCNLLAMLSGLGRHTAFMGKVGDDNLGRMLYTSVQQVGIDCTGLVIDKTVNTTVAFVQTKANGERDFTFFRSPGADTCLLAQELDMELIKQSKLFHFGSLSLTHQPAREATVQAVSVARAAGVPVSYDPNLRVPLWSDLNVAKEQMLWGVKQCDIIKVAVEELEFLTGCHDIADGVGKLFQYGQYLKVVLVTCGADGAWAFGNGSSVFCAAFPVDAIDTTGAGDTFFGCCLHYLLDHSMDSLTDYGLMEMLRFANAAAGLVTTRKGALRSMPRREEIEKLLENG